MRPGLLCAILAAGGSARWLARSAREDPGLEAPDRDPPCSGYPPDPGPEEPWQAQNPPAEERQGDLEQAWVGLENLRDSEFSPVRPAPKAPRRPSRRRQARHLGQSGAARVIDGAVGRLGGRISATPGSRSRSPGPAPQCSNICSKFEPAVHEHLFLARRSNRVVVAMRPASRSLGRPYPIDAVHARTSSRAPELRLAQGCKSVGGSRATG